jgi:hypothetical protein
MRSHAQHKNVYTMIIYGGLGEALFVLDTNQNDMDMVSATDNPYFCIPKDY